MNQKLLRLLSMGALLGGVALYTVGCDDGGGEGTADAGLSGGGGSGGGGVGLGGLFTGQGESGNDSEPASVEDCERVCEAVLSCMELVCEAPLPGPMRAEGLSDCTSECKEMGTEIEIITIDVMTGNECQGIRETLEEGGFCGGGGGTGGTGGTGGDDNTGGSASAACQAFCEVAQRCCDESDDCGDEDQMTVAECASYCPYMPDALLTCVAQRATESCESIEIACEEFAE